MAGVNKVILVGNLGKDPETRHLDGGSQVTTFSLATGESYKDKNGQRVEKTEWHNIVVWNKLSEIVEKYVKKGQTVYIEGKLATRKWQDKEGQDRYTTEIVATNLTMLGGGKDQTNHSSEHQASREQQAGTFTMDPDADNDLPF